MSFNFIPIPQEASQKITVKIDVDVHAYDDNASIQKAITRVRKEAKAKLKNIRRDLEGMDFRGFSRGNKKDITTQVKWLYWHLTPPYFSEARISKAYYESVNIYVEASYIERCYLAMAKLLGITLTKGRRRGIK
jgi:hypothetical protein